MTQDAFEAAAGAQRGPHAVRDTESRRLWIYLVAVAAAFVVSSRPYLLAPPALDSAISLWLARELPWWATLVDSLVAGYGYVFLYEPAFTVMHLPDATLVRWLGAAGHHLLALLGLLGAAAALARLVLVVSRSAALGAAAAALFLLSSASWYQLADTAYRHYPYATWMGLLALAPAVRAWAIGTRPGLRESLLSAAAYGIGLACKESIAAVPLLVFTLLWVARRSLFGAGLFVVPHAVVLVLMVAWRVFILGGVGGYFLFPPALGTNLIDGVRVLFVVLWGSAWPAVALLACSLWLRPASAVLWVTAWITALAPFALGYGMLDTAYFAAKLPLLLALFLLLLGASLARARAPIGRIAIACVVLLLLVAQWRQRPLVATAIAAEAHAADFPASPWTEPIAFVSDHWVLYTYEHQLQAAPKAPMVGYRNEVDWSLDRALGNTLPEDAVLVNVPRDAASVSLAPLELDGLELGADARGRFHLRLPPDAGDGLRLAFVYRNGATRWVASFEVARTRADFPLNYSIERIVLFRPGPGNRWPARVWWSPFFRNPYPAPALEAK